MNREAKFFTEHDQKGRIQQKAEENHTICGKKV